MSLILLKDVERCNAMRVQHGTELRFKHLQAIDHDLDHQISGLESEIQERKRRRNFATLQPLLLTMMKEEMEREQKERQERQHLERLQSLTANVCFYVWSPSISLPAQIQIAPREVSIVRPEPPVMQKQAVPEIPSDVLVKHTKGPEETGRRKSLNETLLNKILKKRKTKLSN
jgi:hypothetical protein